MQLDLSNPCRLPQMDSQGHMQFLAVSSSSAKAYGGELQCGERWELPNVEACRARHAARSSCSSQALVGVRSLPCQASGCDLDGRANHDPQASLPGREAWRGRPGGC